MVPLTSVGWPRLLVFSEVILVEKSPHFEEIYLRRSDLKVCEMNGIFAHMKLKLDAVASGPCVHLNCQNG